MTGCARALLGLILARALAGTATAPELTGSGWVNVPELDLERLRGKIVLLYFFEET